MKKYDCPKCGVPKTLREMRPHLKREHGYTPEEIQEAIALLKDPFKPTSKGSGSSGPRPANRAFNYDMQGRISPILNVKEKKKK